MTTPITSPANSELYKILLGSAKDGRGLNARYCQNQLLCLHKCLRANAEAIREAIRQDASVTQLEIDTEFGLSLVAIRKLYGQINFPKQLKDEYRLVRHEDNPEARVPHGIVLVRPPLHTRFFSIVAALATAFAAGNVVLLELENGHLSVDAFFKTVFETYDGEALVIATSRVEDVHFLNQCLIVDQSEIAVPGTNVLAHQNAGPVVAILDRTADVSAAAHAIIRSKCYFRGTSSSAVDIVLVNEWVKERFIAQCKEAIKSETASVKRVNQSSCTQRTAGEDKEAAVLLDTGGIVVSEVHPGARTLKGKSSNMHIRLVTVTGLVDTMTIITNMGSLPVVFCFSDDHQAKYLGQHVDCQLFVVNQIPISLLVGPGLPSWGDAPDLEVRYSTSMMSKPAPQFISDLDRSLESLRKEENLRLKPAKQGSGFDIGFFDRGAILGAVTILIPMLGLFIYTGYQAAGLGYRLWVK